MVLPAIVPTYPEGATLRILLLPPSSALAVVTRAEFPMPTDISKVFAKLKARNELERKSPGLKAARLAAEAEARQKYKDQQRSLLRQGAEAWNQWRTNNGRGPVELRSIDLADWPGLAGVDFSDCDLTYADLRWSTFTGANFRGANLGSADLTEASFDGADFTGATFDRTILGATDLSGVKGLKAIQHRGPSIIGVETLFLSRGKLPDSFLEGAGVPRPLVDYLPSLTGAIEPLQFNSCFISYATADEPFARRLHSRMRAAELRVWFAPEDIKGGEKIVEQIERAIHVHEKLLLVLSDSSMRSNWVTTELRRARKIELSESRRKLFPIRLVKHDRVREWTCFDADRGVDLAAEVREYFIPDFSNWKDEDAFERGFKRLLQDLRKAGV